MIPPVSARAMRPQDIDVVLDIQLKCYDSTKLESRDSFRSKLDASPETCFVALRASKTVGYLVSVPAGAGGPIALNSRHYVRPPKPNALYLHDLAVDPEARGAGVAAVLLAPYFLKLRGLRLSYGTLTAVNDSRAFWQRRGFLEVVPAGCDSLASYGHGARFMRLSLEQQG